MTKVFSYEDGSSIVRALTAQFRSIFPDQELKQMAVVKESLTTAIGGTVKESLTVQTEIAFDILPTLPAQSVETGTTLEATSEESN